MKIRRYIKGDRIIWMVILILLVISLLSVYSSTGSLAYQHRSGNTFFYLFRQLKFILLGVLIIFFVHLVPYRIFSRVSVFALYLSIPLLILTLVVGTNINEATRWLQIPGTGLTIQPSDFAKIALVMYLAKILSVNQNNIKDFKGVFGKISLAIIGTCALILPANFSTALIVFVTAFSLMFVGRIPVRYLGLMIFTGVFALSIFIGGALLLKRKAGLQPGRTGSKIMWMVKETIIRPIRPRWLSYREDFSGRAPETVHKGILILVKYYKPAIFTQLFKNF